MAGCYSTTTERWPAGMTAPAGRRLTRSAREAILLLAVLAAWAGVAKLSHGARPALAFVLGILVLGLALRSYHLGVALFVLSFAFLPLLPGRILGIFALNPTNLMVVGLLVPVLLRSVRPESDDLRRSGDVPAAWLLLFWLWLVVEVFVAVFRLDVTFDGPSEACYKFIIATLPIFFGAWAARQGSRPRAFVAGATLTSCALINAWAYVGYKLDLGEGASVERLRLQGRLSQANNFGAFLALSLPWWIALGMSGRSRWQRAAGWVGGALSASCLLATQSRGSMLAAVAGLLGLALLRYRILLVGLLLGGLFVTSLVPAHVLGRFEEVEEDSDVRLSGTNIRKEHYLFAPELIRLHPIVGTGLRGYYVVPRQLGRRALTRSPHSWYLESIVETGLVGFGLVGGLTLATVRGLWRRQRRRERTFDAVATSALLGSTAALAVLCFFQNPFMGNEMIVPFYFVGLGLVLGVTPARARGDGAAGPRRAPDPAGERTP
jgi:O-antigen ligase